MQLADVYFLFQQFTILKCAILATVIVDIGPYRSTGITCEKNNVGTSDTGIIETALSYTQMK